MMSLTFTIMTVTTASIKNVRNRPKMGQKGTSRAKIAKEEHSEQSS